MPSGSSGHVILGQIALLQRSKRQDVTIKIGGALKQRGIAVDILLLGAARKGGEEYVNELKALAETERVAEETHFMGYRADVENWLKVMDVLVIPSSEGFPLVGLEAAAADVPVLAIDEGGAKELVEVIGNGLLFTLEDNVDEIAENLVHFLGSTRGTGMNSQINRIFGENNYKKSMRNSFSQVLTS